VWSQTPVCTGEGWMMVLRGDVSQWKRSRCEMFAHQVGVGFGPERFEARRIEVYARGEISLLKAENDHAGIDELLPLDAGHDAQEGVIKRGGSGHGSPPVRRYAQRRGACKRNPDSQRGVRLR